MIELVTIVERMKREIVEGVRCGVIPYNVTRFGDLDDYVDANCLADLCEDEVFDALVEQYGGRDEHEGIPQGMIDFINDCEDAVDAWIKSGGIALELGTLSM
jgi:hypothetical protein